MASLPGQGDHRLLAEGCARVKTVLRLARCVPVGLPEQKSPRFSGGVKGCDKPASGY
jgi:hypothetical protein